jgi:two-component system sensor histidine kinase KdpD
MDREEQSSKKEKKEHVVVCLSSSEFNPRAISAAAARAQEAKAVFTAVFIQTPAFEHASEKERLQLRSNSDLALRLGAFSKTITANDPAAAIARYAREAEATLLVMGHDQKKSKNPFAKSSLPDKVMEQVSDCEVLLVCHPAAEHQLHFPQIRMKNIFKDGLISLLILVLSTCIGLSLYKAGVGEGAIAPVYLLAILIIAMNTTSILWPTLSALLSITLLAYLFIEPLFTFRFYNPDYPIIIAVTLMTALISGFLASQLHAQSEEARQSSALTQTLLETQHILQRSSSAADIIPAVCSQIQSLLGRDVLFYPVENETLLSPSRYLKEDSELLAHPEALDAEKATAMLCAKSAAPAGRGTKIMPASRCIYLPWQGARQLHGVIGILLDKANVDPIKVNVIRSIISEGALALDNKIQEEQIRAIRRQNQDTQLRTTILRAVSHDLRTPLTSIVGNIGSLNETSLDENQRETVKEVNSSANALANMIENMLVSARLTNGKIAVKGSLEEVPDIVRQAVDSANPQLKEPGVLHMEITDDLLFAKVDGTLMIRALTNILNNAIEHNQEGTHVEVKVFAQKENAVIEIADDGSGIPLEIREKVFDLFYTGEDLIPDSNHSLGLGLFLSRTIITGHGGTLEYKDNFPKGSRFIISIPQTDISQNFQP